MPSDRQRLVGAIRRIANIDTDYSSRSTPSTNRGSQPGSVGMAVTESNERICCDGSVSGITNPGTSTNDPSENSGEGLDSSDPADIPSNVSGLVDCDTGEPVCFDGSGFVPPDGWDSPTEPPVDPLYSAGTFWQEDVSGVIYRGPTPSSVCLQHANNTGGGGTSKWYYIGYTEEDENFVLCDGVTFQPDGTPVYGVYGDTGRVACSSGDGDYCSPGDDDKLLRDPWPLDGCVNLSIAGGKIVGSKYDPENDGSYSAPRDEIELCDGSNGSILIRGSAGGGWKSIASLSGDIDPDTDHGYLYSAYGDVIRQISPSEFRDDRV